MAQNDNPLLKEFNTPFGVPPFSEIKIEHYKPAFEAAVAEHQKEIDAIVNNKAVPTFQNTIEALDKSGKLLDKVGSVFYNMSSANTNDELQKVSREITPMMTTHYNNISLNPVLFSKVKSVYESPDKAKLNPEEKMLLEKTYKGFVRQGANLNEDQKTELRKINDELAMLTLNFGENLLKETNNFLLIVDKKEDLAGLPEVSIAGAAELAKAKGHDGKWIFTLQKPSLIPFLQYSEKRDLREKIFKAYINRGDNNNEYDNKKIISRIAALRVKYANLLGYKNYADYVLEERMSKDSRSVYNLLNQLWTPALNRAKNEAGDLQKLIDSENAGIKLEAWDWWYYAEKLKKQKYAIDDEVLRPYFKLENVRQGAFDVATKLYGITFTERTDIPVYHKDVKTFEVKEADGKHIGILMLDYFPRESKRVGAWMSAYRKQFFDDGKNVTPVIVNVGNFSQPVGDDPSLLTFDEVETLFHEFGHGLHGLLSYTKYNTLSGTSVPRDFVELPSQIMENWAAEPEVMKMYAKHYKTGDVIPDELIEKLKNAALFNQGFATVEYLSASLLDMNWHTLTDTLEVDANKFEKEYLDKISMMPEIVVRYRSPYFNHIFASGYAAGYYSYIWSEVLDSDAFQAFKETTLFNKELAQKFREHVLSKGGTEEPMDLYKKFRGREPKIDALLKKRGLDTVL